MKRIAYIGIDYHMETVSVAVIIEGEKDFFDTIRLRFGTFLDKLICRLNPESSGTADVSLPSNLQLQLGGYVTIDMDTDRPYTQFGKHKRKYPPGQLKKKKKNKKWAKY